MNKLVKKWKIFMEYSDPTHMAVPPEDYEKCAAVLEAVEVRAKADGYTDVDLIHLSIITKRHYDKGIDYIFKGTA